MKTLLKENCRLQIIHMNIVYIKVTKGGWSKMLEGCAAFISIM